MVDSPNSRLETKPEVNISGVDSAVNGLSAQGARELSSAPGVANNDNSFMKATGGSSHPAQPMTLEGRIVFEQKMSKFGPHRHTLGSCVMEHAGCTMRPPIFNKDGDLVGFGRGINRQAKIYFYKDYVRVPVTDEMAVYKDNYEKLGWKFSDVDTKQPKILSMKLMTDGHPEELDDGEDAFRKFVKDKVRDSDKKQVVFVTPGFNMTFAAMEAQAADMQRDTGLLSISIAWESLQRLWRLSADQAGIEVNYHLLADKILTDLRTAQKGESEPTLRSNQINLTGFSKGAWPVTEFVLSHPELFGGNNRLNSVTVAEGNMPALVFQRKINEIADRSNLVMCFVSNPHKPHSDKPLKVAKFVDTKKQLGDSGPELAQDLKPGHDSVFIIERNILNSGSFLATDHEYPSRVYGYLLRYIQQGVRRGLGLALEQNTAVPNYYVLAPDKGVPKSCRVYGKNPSTRDCTDMPGTNDGNSSQGSGAVKVELEGNTSQDLNAAGKYEIKPELKYEFAPQQVLVDPNSNESDKRK